MLMKMYLVKCMWLIRLWKFFVVSEVMFIYVVV